MCIIYLIVAFILYFLLFEKPPVPKELFHGLVYYKGILYVVDEKSGMIKLCHFFPVDHVRRRRTDTCHYIHLAQCKRAVRKFIKEKYGMIPDYSVIKPGKKVLNVQKTSFQGIDFYYDLNKDTGKVSFSFYWTTPKNTSIRDTVCEVDLESLPDHIQKRFFEKDD